MRTALTVAAIAFSVSLVVGVTSGYASLLGAVHVFMNRFMGSTDATIVRQSRGGRGGVPETLLDDLRADHRVKGVLGRLEMPARPMNAAGQTVGKFPGRVVGVRRPEDKLVDSLNLQAGKWFDGDEGNVAVIDQVASEQLGAKIGDDFYLPGMAEDKLKLTVVGIALKPGFLAHASQTIYVPLRTLQEFVMAGEPRQVSRVMLELHEGVDAPAFAAEWQQRLGGVDPALKIKLARDNKSEVDKNLQAVHILSYLGGTISMLAATFIVFSTLSMGVAERSRTLAMMRAIGAFRSQVAKLVVVEGMLLSLAGVIVGIPLGLMWVGLLALRYKEVFTAGVLVSWGGVMFGAIGSLTAALLASLLPAYSAMRVSPLEAMTDASAPPRRGVSIGCALAGLVLIAVDPFLFYGPFRPAMLRLGFAPEVTKGMQFYGHFVVGMPALMVGFFLLAPLFVTVIERLLAPPVAVLFFLRPALVRQQLSSGVWRAAGTCAALMVGLATLVVMQTQGNSALSSWRLPDKFPDIFITINYLFTNGIKSDLQRKISMLPAVKPINDPKTGQRIGGELMAIAVTSPELGSNMIAIAGMSLMPNATMFFGVDPEIGERMMELEYRDDNGKPVSPDEQKRLAKQSYELMRQGRHILITDEFRQLKGLKVGDKFPLKTRHGMVDYTIAGIVWSPGLDVIESRFDMGQQFNQRTAASVFGTIDDAKRDFGVEDIWLFGANLQGGIPRDKLKDDLQAMVGGMSLVQAYDVRQIKHDIETAFHRLLLMMSTVAFAAMAVASLGVTNTIMASIRTRRWQFGILRSIGVTRDQLLRFVLVEAVLLGIVGCALGLAAGFEIVLDAKALSAAMLGYNPPTVVPWGIVSVGMGVVMFIALAASIAPALHVARSEPLTLLAAGRAAT